MCLILTLARGIINKLGRGQLGGVKQEDFLSVLKFCLNMHSGLEVDVLRKSYVKSVPHRMITEIMVSL